MIKHYFKIPFRLSGKNARISLVNILGLAVGLAACTLIFIYVSYETGYDSLIKDNDRVFRVEEESIQANNGGRRALCRNFIGLELEKMDEVEALGRIYRQRPSTVSYGDVAFKESGLFFASNGLFNVFSFNVLEGRPSIEMDNPKSVVITDKIRERYFGKESACQKLLKIDTAYYRVAGVVEEFPSNSHFHFDILLSYVSPQTAHGVDGELALFGFGTYTYVKLREGVDPNSLAKKLYDLPAEIASEYLKKNGDNIHIFLNNIRSIHFDQGVMHSFEPSGNIKFLGLLIATGLLILLTTCLNYMNLSTSRFITRNREIGMRKTFGAGKVNLVSQFLGESISEVIIAYLIAMSLVEISLVPLGNLIHAELNLPYLQADFLIFVVSIIIFTGLVAGSYPALMLSSVNPVNVIRNAGIPGKGSYLFRRVLVIFQFMISIFLIMATLVVSRQLKYMNESPLGFVKEQKLIFQLPEGKVNLRNFDSVKKRFSDTPFILGSSVSSSVPGRPTYNWLTWPSNEKLTLTRAIASIQADFDFIKIYGLQVIAGESFNPGLSFSQDWGVLINQAAIRTFGWESEEEALKKELHDDHTRVKGIIRDFHYFGMNQEISALALYRISEDFRYLTLSFRENSAKKVLDRSCSVYRKLFPGYAVDYFFLDDDFALQYENEKETGNLVMVFTILAVFIACLGLYGMTAYTLVTRKRAYSLMKVNGASSASIYMLILEEILVHILVSFAIVTPIVFNAGTVWLKQFPYHINLSAWIFFSSALILLGVSVATINFETYRIFRLNPAETMRSE